MPKIPKKGNPAGAIAGVFLAIGVLLLVFAVFLEQQVIAFIGLGFTFWGAIFALTRSNRYVEGVLLDSTAESTYTTIDRMVNDLTFTKQGYYIPAYPRDVSLPDYLKTLKEPVVFISAPSLNGTPSVDELAQGKFLSTRSQGIFIISPGAGLLAQMEKQVQLDFSKISLQELAEVLPRLLTDVFTLAKTADLKLTENGAVFKATGIVYESLYHAQPPLKSVNILGCPVVSAVASALAKTSRKMVVISEQVLSPNICGVNATFNFVGGSQ
jgi:hypothetical protein